MKIKVYVWQGLEQYLPEEVRKDNVEVREFKPEEFALLCKDRFCIFVLPLVSGGEDVFSLVERLRQDNDDAQVIILSNREWDLDTTRRCISLGVKGIFKMQGEDAEITEAFKSACNMVLWMMRTHERLRRLKEENEKIKRRLQQMKEGSSERSSGTV